MAVTSSFVIGSVEDLPAYAVNIGGATTTVTGDYYLWDATASRSLCDHFASVMATAGVTNPDVFITESGHVRITADTSFTIIWSDSTLRDIFGFTATTGPTTGATAPNRSPWLWVPGWPETPASPVGTSGNKVKDTIVTSSASGLTSKFTTRTTKTRQKFSWRHVAQASVWTTSESGGEFRKFADDHLDLGYRFKLYSGCTLDSTSNTEFSSTYTLGPYKVENPGQWRFQREDPARDAHSPIEIACCLVSEYS